MKKILIILIIFLVLVLGIFFFLTKDKEEPQKPQATQEPVHVVPARPENYEDALDSYFFSYRKARIALEQENLDEAEFYLKESLALWADVIDEYGENPPPSYQDKEEWGRAIQNTEDNLQLALESTKKKNIDSAIERLSTSRESIKSNELQKSKYKDDYKLHSLLEIVKKIDSATSLEEAKSYFTDLKLSYTDTKQLADQEKFQKAYQDFEDVLFEMETMQEKNYQNIIQKLLPSFLSIYELY